MRSTEERKILVGETATAFFTGASRGEVHNVDLVLYNANVESCANSRFSFLEGETIMVEGSPHTPFWIKRYVLIYDNHVAMAISRITY
jgi:hypothetical protein